MNKPPLDVKTSLTLTRKDLIAVLRVAGYDVTEDASVTFNSGYHDPREPFAGSGGSVIVSWKGRL